MQHDTQQIGVVWLFCRHAFEYCICNALNIYDCNSHGQFIGIKTVLAIAFRSHVPLWLHYNLCKRGMDGVCAATQTLIFMIGFTRFEWHVIHIIISDLPELSSVCVWTPWLTFPEPVSAAKPRNFSIVLTASCSVFTADNSYVSSSSTHAANEMENGD